MKWGVALVLCAACVGAVLDDSNPWGYFEEIREEPEGMTPGEVRSLQQRLTDWIQQSKQVGRLMSFVKKRKEVAAGIDPEEPEIIFHAPSSSESKRLRTSPPSSASG